jgi:hypothetical protein
MGGCNMETNSDGNHFRQSKKIKYVIIGLGLLSTLIITIVSIYGVVYSPRSKNERAIEAVITSLLTCPDTELTQLMELCATKVGPGFIEEPKTDDLERFDDKMKDMFGSYLTEDTLAYIITNALRYHTIAEEKGVEMWVDDIEINHDNKDSRNYTFTIQLNYASPSIGERQLFVSGRAQCLEVGKITFLRFSDDFFKNEYMNNN